MDFKEITVGVDDGVATLTLNRPERLNAYTDVMARELRDAVHACARDKAVRVIVLTGAGRGFCAGADMERLNGATENGAGGLTPSSGSDDTFPEVAGPDVSAMYPGRFGYMLACPKPIVAAINGPCAGIGLVIALFADLRFAAEEAKFTTAFSARGLVAEHGIAWMLPRLVGEANALDLLMTARKFDGREAERLGLVNRAVAGEALTAQVGEVARGLAHDVSPRAVAVMKRQVRAAMGQNFAESLRIADQEMKGSFEAPDFREGVRSFMEKRPPQFAPV